MDGYDFVGLGYCSNDHVCVLPQIPIDSKAEMLQHAVLGGGPSATSTVAAARLGMTAAYIGVVGDDGDGQRILRDFAQSGVSTRGVIVRSGMSSPVAYCWIDASCGARSVAWTRGGLPELRPGEVDYDLVRRARILHLDGHNAAAAVSAAMEARRASVLINYDAGTLRDGTEELLWLSDIIICSHEFASKVTGISDAERAVRKIHSDYKPLVAGLTMGVGGSIATDGKYIFRCPAFRVDRVVDTTGCGDVFHTGFALRYSEDGDVGSALRFGSAVAAIKCGKLGGRPGIPTRAETEAFLASSPHGALRKLLDYKEEIL